jgi:hypothetical protein
MISMGTLSGIAKKNLSQWVPPFGVGAKIGDRGFDFDDKNRGVHGERDDVGAPSRKQRQFGDGRKVEPPQQPPRAARDKKRRPGLAAVLRREWLWQSRHGGPLIETRTQAMIAEETRAMRLQAPRSWRIFLNHP